jgi:hypothetical protein
MLLELARQRFELNEFEEQLFSTIERDEIVDFSSSPESCIQADRIFWLLTDSQAQEYLTHKRLWIKACQIDSVLNLDNRTIVIPLIFEGCTFTQQISFARAKIYSLQLTGSLVESINAERVKVEHEVCLDSGFESKQEVNLSYGSIGGDLNCIGGKFKKGSKKFALNATAIEVRGNARLNKIKAEGEVRFIAANITYQLDCDGGSFINPLGRFALIAQSIRVKTLRLSEGFIAEGSVDLSGAFIGGCFTCDGGEFNGVKDQGYALNAERIEVGSTVSMMKNFKAKGGVNLNYAKIRGVFQCKGQLYSYKFSGNQTSEHDNDYALTAEYAEFASAVYIREGFEAKGRVRLFKAEIGGDLECTEGQFYNPDRSAFDASEAKINGKVLMSKGFKAEGEVSLIRATIGSNLTCDEGQFLNANGVALHAECIEIKGTTSLKNVIARGIVYFLNARIGGNLECDGGNIDNCRCSSERFTNSENYSLMAECVEINGSLLLRRGFHSRGKVRLFKAKIGGDLDCGGGHFDNPGDSAIEADYVNISGNIIINKGFKSKGRISLKNTIVRGTLYHDKESWPQKGQLMLAGFTYNKIQTEDTKTLLDWLKLSTPFSLQPYNHLAEVLKKSGNERDQKRILIESQKEYLKFGKFGWTEKVSKQLLGHIMDFGYSPLKALGYSLVLITISYSYFDWGKSHQLILPAKIKVDGNHLALTEINPDYPKFNPIIYSIDTFIPIINLQQREYWLPASGDQAKQAYQKSFKAEQLSFNNNDVPDPIRLQYLSLDYYLGCFLPYYFWIHTIFGWIFTTLSVAGFTGLVRRLN